MTNKEIADRLRDLSDGGVMNAEARVVLVKRADELDSPKSSATTPKHSGCCTGA